MLTNGIAYSPPGAPKKPRFHLLRNLKSSVARKLSFGNGGECEDPPMAAVAGDFSFNTHPPKESWVSLEEFIPKDFPKKFLSTGEKVSFEEDIVVRSFSWTVLPPADQKSVIRLDVYRGKSFILSEDYNVLEITMAPKKSLVVRAGCSIRFPEGVVMWYHTKN